MQVTVSIYYSLIRQVNHWLQAATRLSALDNLASGNAWHGIEHKMGVLLKDSLKKSVDEVVSVANGLKKQLENAEGQENLRSIKRGLLQLRNKYLKAEETIHFYTISNRQLLFFHRMPYYKIFISSFTNYKNLFTNFIF